MIVGRGDVLEELAGYLADRRPVVVVGEAGVGKTTVLRAAAAAHTAAADSATGHSATAHTAAAHGKRTFEGGALATLSWMECLPLQRAIGAALPRGDAQAVATRVLRTVRNGVLLLDDLHWADGVTIEAAVLLATHCGLLTALRRAAPGSGPILDRLLGAGFAEVALAPLDGDDAADLLHDLRPDLAANVVSRLVHRSGGNPLLLSELAHSPDPSPSLRLMLLARLRQLDVPGRDAFGLLALAGRPLDPGILGRAGAKSLLDADLAVAIPADTGPADTGPADTGPAGPALSLRHALLAEVVEEAFDPEERRELHRRLARALPEPGEAARHYARAAEAQPALACALAAADTAERPGERASHLALAASVAEGLGSAGLASAGLASTGLGSAGLGSAGLGSTGLGSTGLAADDLRMRAALALDEAHDWVGMTAVLEQITSTDPDVMARAQLLLARGAWAAGDIEALRAALTSGLELVGGTGSPVEVQLRIEQSRLPIFVDVDLGESVRMSREALNLARATGVDVPRAEYLHGTALAIADQPGGDEHLQSAMLAARAAGDVDTEFLAANNLISFHESGGSQQRARQVAEQMIGRSGELGLGRWESAMRGTLVNLDVHAGNYQQVVPTAEQLLDQPLEARTRDMLIECLGLTLIDLGRADEAVRRVAEAKGEAAQDYRGQGQLTWVLAEAALWSGQPARALDLIGDFLNGPPDDPNLWFGKVARAWACVELGQDPGEAAAPHERPMLLGAEPETEALRLLHLGDNIAAAERFQHAAALWAPYHRRGEVRCAWAAGEALRRAGETVRAIAALEAAEELAQLLGAALFLARIRRSLRTAGQHRSAPRSGRRGPGRGGGLTDRERQVLELVRVGLTNAHIATQLGITQRTVVALVASASAELGAANRSHAAALAAAEPGPE